MSAVEPRPNARAHPYRGVSVQHVEQTPDADFMRDYLLGRDAYRRTQYVALIHGDEVGLASVDKESTEPLFSPVTDVNVWSGPGESVFVDAPSVDVGNATALAEVASSVQQSGVSAYVIQGKFQHVNFIWEPAPVEVFVTEVTPPTPPKLLVQAKQVIAFDEDLPPIALTLDEVSFDEMASTMPSSRYLLPCRGAGITVPGAEVHYLDTGPAERLDWVMIGCERSRQIHEHFYGSDPRQVDFCPRKRFEETPPEGKWLIKCCLIERGTEYPTPDVAIVPWGANLDEVRAALRKLAGVTAVDEVSAGT